MKVVFTKMLAYLKMLFIKIRPSLIAIAIGLLMGFIVMLIFNPAQSVPAFFQLLLGGLNKGSSGIGSTIYRAAPIILTGLSVAFAFKTGLFNIGASGQMMMGAYVAIHIGVLWELPPTIHVMVALLGGMVAGMLWGMIVGLLKAFRNVNEVVTSIMMNYIAANLLIILIRSNVYNSASARSLGVSASALLPSLNIFAGSSANIGFGITVIVVIVTHIIIHKTTLGFELRATGFSFDGARYAGMNIKRNTLISFAFAGLFSGLAGGVAYLVSGKTISISYTIFTEGFDGISVALLGMGEPVGALFAGLFLSHIRQGGFYMQLFGFVPEIIDIIISVIIYVSAISAALPGILKTYKLAKQKRIEDNNLIKEGK